VAPLTGGCLTLDRVAPGDDMSPSVPDRHSVDAVLVDLYDTLAWADMPRLEAGRDALARHAGVDPERMRQAFRATAAERVRGSHTTLEGDLAAVLKMCDETPNADLLAFLAREAYAMWHSSVQLFADTLPSLARLRRAGLRLAIVSNCSREAGSVVSVLGLTPYVDTIVLSCEVGLAKPDPAIYRLALDRLATMPRRAILVDDVSANLDTAHTLGLGTVMILRYSQPADNACEHVIIRRLDELPPMVAMPHREPTERRTVDDFGDTTGK
jgi:putative hydrolase of the HAD superfamily